MDYESPNKRALVQLVQKCLNENGEGFIERQQFISFCADLSVSAEELDNVFNELDSDRDGKINVSDFTSTFDQVSGTLGKVGETTDPCNGHMVNGSIDKSMYECQVNALESPMQVIAGQQYISELYYNLTNSNQSDLLELFEKHLASVVKDIKSRAAENQRLEEALKRATKQHARQVNNLDREVEQQMEKLEAKVRQEEKSLSEKKLSDFQWQLESKEKEIGSMNQTIDILQSRLNKETSRPSRKDEMDTITQENRFLRSQVTDSQTAIAVLRSELAEIRSEFVEQSEQLQKEQRVSHDSVQEQENLTRQLQLLHEANQKLHDINDELRGALEAKKITNSPSKVTSEVLTIPGSCNDPGRDMAFTPIRCHSASPSLGFRHPGHRNVPGECCENSLNEDSLFSEIHRASTIHEPDGPTVVDTNDNTTTNNDSSQKTTLTTDPDKRFSSRIPVLKRIKLRASLPGTDASPQTTDCSIKNTILAKIMTSLAFRNSKSPDAILGIQKTDNGSLETRKELPKSPIKNGDLISNNFARESSLKNSVVGLDTESEFEMSKLDTIESDKFVLGEKSAKNESFFSFRSESSMMDSDLKGIECNSAKYDRGMLRPNSVCGKSTNSTHELQPQQTFTLRTKELDLLTEKHSFNEADIQNHINKSQTLSLDSLENIDKCKDLSGSSYSVLSVEKLDVVVGEGISSKCCTYAEFEELFEAENPSTYPCSSPSISFALTSVSSYFLTPEPYKSDCEEEDEAYGTMSKPTNGQVQKQIQILEDTNKRLSSSNDELRVALKLMSRSGSFRKSKRSSSGSRRIASGSHSDYGSISSRSSRSFSPKKQKRSSTDDLGGEATDESTTYVDDDNVETVSDSTTMNSEPIADLESQFLKTNNNEEVGERYKNKDEKEEKDEDDDEGDEQENDEEEDEEEEDEEEEEEEEEDEDEDEDDDDDDDEDDEDDDDINSTELADLVALASDLTDVSDSDSELEGDCMGQRSFASSTIATMTTESLNLSYSTPERMYKLVLAGDAAVGKSSFILRLCKNRFHSSLNATLGVDFQVKNILVDSKMVALQLWDTAGQERFRSIAKSYFRKVDGVILLYDVTSESSFIHIRDWMRTIEESSHKKVPIILCGNKCDLREECAREGRKVITRENGQRLAKSYDALFIETSAKDGKHVHDACQELARILTSLENQEIEQSGLKLDNRDKEKKKRTCCPS